MKDGPAFSIVISLLLLIVTWIILDVRRVKEFRSRMKIEQAQRNNSGTDVKLKHWYFVKQRGLLWDVIKEDYIQCEYYRESTWKTEAEAEEHARMLNEKQ